MGPLCRNAQQSAESSQELDSPKTPRMQGRGSVRREWEGWGGAKVTGADELFSTTQGCCVLPCLSYDSAATFSSSWSLAVGGRGGYILLCPFHFQADGTRGNTDALVESRGRGLRQRFKKRTPTFTHNPSMPACGKLDACGRRRSGLSTR